MNPIQLHLRYLPTVVVSSDLICIISEHIGIEGLFLHMLIYFSLFFPKSVGKGSPHFPSRSHKIFMGGHDNMRVVDAVSFSNAI